jgi:hypothetical protein
MVNITNRFSDKAQEQIEDPPYYILCVGEDILLMRTRRLILESEGYFVCAFPSERIANCPTPSRIALALLCHTLQELPLDDSLEWIRRNCPQAKVLLLEGPGVRRGHAWDLPRASTQPAEMLGAVRKMLGNVDNPQSEVAVDIREVKS